MGEIIRNYWDIIILNTFLVIVSFIIIYVSTASLTFMLALGASDESVAIVGSTLLILAIVALFCAGYKLPRLLPKHNWLSFIVLTILVIVPATYFAITEDPAILAVILTPIVMYLGLLLKKMRRATQEPNEGGEAESNTR